MISDDASKKKSPFSFVSKQIFTGNRHYFIDYFLQKAESVIYEQSPSYFHTFYRNLDS